MTQRDPSAYVWDIRDACRTIEQAMRGMDREQYLNSTMHRLAIERLLITIGEAMGRLAKVDAAMAAELGEVGQIVGFRNVLVHQYFDLDHTVVWEVLRADVPRLLANAERVWSRFAPLYESDEPDMP